MKNYYLLLFLLFGLFGKAQIINFPDANFKAKLLAASPSNTIALDVLGNYVKIDTNNNSEIEENEVTSIKALNVQISGISNLGGLTYFINLEDLVCSNNPLISLDFSDVNNFSNLKNIDCSGCGLTSLNVENRTLLNRLITHYNPSLTSLTFVSNYNLQFLICSLNQLTSLDLTQTNVKHLNCSHNNISNIVFNPNITCQSINLSDNNLSSLNLNF
ncbi:leucine-rich repeat domain-containing protein [Flavobacterium bernardetii]|uniref:hypothetical protein n=1 Tax=Flavobacterium bernardetii TaxID=2813823 RepID=UPI001CED8941|nr:hypothetical protein [Flavobacterium bernardetii]